MPCPHNKITLVKRSQLQSAVAAAAYQSGEKLFCEYDQEVKHYPKKRAIVHNEILLPANAPKEYADRNTLWNSAEEMNLKDSQGNFLTSLTVVKDQFCVVYDYTSVNIAVADDNTMENVLIPKYALLSQDDYFHSRDSFHPISNDSF